MLACIGTRGASGSLAWQSTKNSVGSTVNSNRSFRSSNSLNCCSSSPPCHVLNAHTNRTSHRQAPVIVSSQGSIFVGCSSAALACATATVTSTGTTTRHVVCMADPRRVAKLNSMIYRELNKLFTVDKKLQEAGSPKKRKGADLMMGAFASVTEVRISKDLEVAKVCF